MTEAGGEAEKIKEIIEVASYCGPKDINHDTDQVLDPVPSNW